MTAAAAAEGVAEVVAETVEVVVDNSGKVLAYVAVLVGSALAVGWLVRSYGERVTDQLDQVRPAYAGTENTVFLRDDQADADDAAEQHDEAESFTYTDEWSPRG